MIVWIASFVATLGYAGVMLLMLAENIVLIVPSEIVMPLAGFAAGRGDVNLWLVIVVGVLGSIIGSLPWYFAGSRLGLDGTKSLVTRFGRWLTVKPSDIDRLMSWLHRYGGPAIFVSRVIPGLRTIGSLGAGISQLRFGRFLGYATSGATLWVTALAIAGYGLGANYQRVAFWLDPVGRILLAGIAALWLYRLARFQLGRERPIDQKSPEINAVATDSAIKPKQFDRIER